MLHGCVDASCTHSASRVGPSNAEVKQTDRKGVKAFLWVDHLIRFPESLLLTYLHHSSDHKIRIERYEATMDYTESFDFVAQFYTDKAKQTGAEDPKMGM